MSLKGIFVGKDVKDRRRNSLSFYGRNMPMSSQRHTIFKKDIGIVLVVSFSCIFQISYVFEGLLL